MLLCFLRGADVVNDNRGRAGGKCREDAAEDRLGDLRPVGVPEDERALAGRWLEVADVALYDGPRLEQALVEHRREARPRSPLPAVDHVVPDADHATAERLRRLR